MDLLFHRQIESDFRFLFLVLSGSEIWRGFVMSDPLIGRFFSFEFWLLCDWLLLFTVYFWPDDAECGLIPKLGYFGRKNIFFIFGNIFGFQFLVIRRICWVKYNGIQNCFENGDLQASKSHSLLAEEYVEYSVAILVSRKLLKTRRQKMARWGHHGAGLGHPTWRPGVIKRKGIPCTIVGGRFWGLHEMGNCWVVSLGRQTEKGGAPYEGLGHQFWGPWKAQLGVD